MLVNLARVAVLAAGDRLVVVALAGGRVETFVVDSEQPATALRAELEARRIRPRTVALGLTRASAIVKPIELPAVGGELRDMVGFELERHVPFAAEETPFDFVPIPRDPATPGAERRVLLVAAD